MHVYFSFGASAGLSSFGAHESVNKIYLSVFVREETMQLMDIGRNIVLSAV